MKLEIIVSIVAFAIWLVGAAIAGRKRHVALEARFWGTRSAGRGKNIAFAAMWFLWGGWALLRTDED